MNTDTHKSSITPLLFLLIFILTQTFYFICYWDDPQIDFIQMYAVGHMWRTKQADWYYDYELKHFGQAYIIQPTPRFNDYAHSLGFDPNYMSN